MTRARGRTPPGGNQKPETVAVAASVAPWLGLPLFKSLPPSASCALDEHARLRWTRGLMFDAQSPTTWRRRRFGTVPPANLYPVRSKVLEMQLVVLAQGCVLLQLR
jgi:hypothetical protein